MRTPVFFLVALASIALILASCAVESPAYGSPNGIRLNGNREIHRGHPGDHGAHHSNHHAGNHHAAHTGCARYLEKSAADIPDFTDPKWDFVDSLSLPVSKSVRFYYTFFHDTTRPKLSIAAMVVRPSGKKAPALTRVSWEVDDEIRTVRLEIEEKVCANPILVKDLIRYNLVTLLYRLELAKGKAEGRGIKPHQSGVPAKKSS